MSYKNSSQLQIRLITKQEQYSVPDTPFVVDSNLATKELNALLNQLLKEYDVGVKQKKVEFDFLAAGQFIRTQLGEHIVSRGISTEDVIDVEYVERLPAPQPQDVLLHDDWVSAVHASDKWILTGCYDNSIHLWSSRGQHKLTISEHTKPVKSVAWLPSSTRGDTSYFISGSHDQMIRLWELDPAASTVECLYVCKGHSGGVETVGVSPDGSRFASGAWDNMLKIWSTSLEDEIPQDEDGISQSKRAKGSSQQVRTPIMTLKGHREAIFDLDWRETSQVVTCSWDHTLRLWDSTVGATLSQISGNKAFFSVHSSPISSLLITSSADTHIRLYDPRSAEGSLCKMTFTSHQSWVMKVRWSPTVDNLFISGSNDNLLKMWDLRSPKAPLYDMMGHEDKILTCDWSQPGMIASGGADNTLRLFKAPLFT